MGQNLRSSITMTDEEIAEFLVRNRTATIATIGPNGVPHLVAMWYAVIDGQIWIETKSKSQKVANLRRDDRITFLADDGLSYTTLRGVSLEGRGVIVDEPDALWKVGIDVFERYSGPYSDQSRPIVEAMIHKRTAVRIDVERTRSWDHRKLGLGEVPVAGTTAGFLS